MRNRTWSGCVAALTLTACSGSAKDTPATDTVAITQEVPPPAGEAYLNVPGGRIWYRVSGKKEGTPLVMLHGGPGFSSFYLKPLEPLGDDRPLVRYDQLGGGKSSPASDTALFNIPHFVAELDSLRSHLGYAKMHLLGHSWGTILAVEYYRAHPDHVASLTLGSAALDIPAWEKHAKDLVKTLPDSMQRAIATREAEQKFDAPDYEAALNAFYGRYVWLHPIQADLDSMLATANQSIYNYMQGPSEFTITGTLKHYDATGFLPQVKVPTLFTVGAVDEANPATIRKHAALVPGARVVVIPGAAHTTSWDNPAAMIAAVHDFLRAVDSAGPGH